MKKLGLATIVAAALTMGSVSGTAMAADAFKFSFNTDSVAFAYRDGYWDHDHHWHKWRHDKESRAFREGYADRFHDWKHDRDHDKGWHD